MRSFCFHCKLPSCAFFISVLHVFDLCLRIFPILATLFLTLATLVHRTPCKIQTYSTLVQLQLQLRFVPCSLEIPKTETTCNHARIAKCSCKLGDSKYARIYFYNSIAWLSITKPCTGTDCTNVFTFGSTTVSSCQPRYFVCVCADGFLRCSCCCCGCGCLCFTVELLHFSSQVEHWKSILILMSFNVLNIHNRHAFVLTFIPYSL